MAVLEPDPVITCIDCGGRAHLLNRRRDPDVEDADAQRWEPGDIATRWHAVRARKFPGQGRGSPRIVVAVSSGDGFRSDEQRRGWTKRESGATSDDYMPRAMRA